MMLHNIGTFLTLGQVGASNTRDMMNGQKALQPGGRWCLLALSFAVMVAVTLILSFSHDQAELALAEGQKPPCPVEPNLPSPDPGCTSYTFAGQLFVNAPDIQPETLDCAVSGEMSVTRSAIGDSVTFKLYFLKGFIDCPGPFSLDGQSGGTITENEQVVPGTMDFPASGTLGLCLLFTPLDGVPLPLLRNCPQNLLPLVCSEIDSFASFKCAVGTTSFYDEFKVVRATVKGGNINFAVPVGGIAELPDVDVAPAGSSGTDTGTLATIVGVTTAFGLALGGAAWYARRRWLR